MRNWDYGPPTVEDLQAADDARILSLESENARLREAVESLLRVVRRPWHRKLLSPQDGSAVAQAKGLLEGK